jgi:hypothetical protein
MAAISQVTVKDAGVPVNLTRVTMTATDTLTFNQGSGQVLVLYNTTASGVTIALTGNAMPSTLSVPGIGGTMSLAGGKSVTVPASGATAIDLDDIYQYLQGTSVTITNGTGLVAMLYA